MSRLRRDKHALVAALFGFAYFVFRTDARLLDPRRVDLVDKEDFSYHVVARNFAQWDDWHWPITKIGNYLWPVGTSSVYTDANPWTTLLAKLLLPADARPLQLVGPWLAICFALQGYFGVKLCAIITRNRTATLLGGCLFVPAPILLTRLGHDTLCAHWILLAMMTNALAPKKAFARTRTGLSVAALLTFAAGLHPTLFAMTVPFALIAVARRGLQSVANPLSLLACICGPALVFVAFGTLRSDTKHEVGGFGEFSANVLALFDPQLPSRSVFLPVLPHEEHQYEGFGYLGLGAILGLAVTVLMMIRRRFGRRRICALGTSRVLGATALACAIFALSSRVYIGQHLIVDASRLYEPFHSLTNAFRSSGRFVWPLVYFLNLAAIAGLSSLDAPWNNVALALVLGLQLADVSHAVDVSKLIRNEDTIQSSPRWILAARDYTEVVLDPPDIESNGFKCADANYKDRYFLPLAEAATRAHLAFNSGQAARLNEERLERYCAEVTSTRHHGEFDSRTIYIPSDANVASYALARNMTCGRIDGYNVCLRSDRPTPFSKALRFP